MYSIIIYTTDEETVAQRLSNMPQGHYVSIWKYIEKVQEGYTEKW